MTTAVIDEKEPFTYTTTLKDAAGVVIPSANLATLTLTLYAIADGTILNSRDAQNIKDVNNGTFHATSGLLTWQAQSADNALVGTIPVGHYEQHQALFQWTTTAGGASNVSKHLLDIFVKSLSKVS